MFGTSTGGFATIRQMILDQIGAILGIANGPADSNVIGGPQWFTSAMADSATMTTAATNNVANVVDIRSRAVEGKLDMLNERLLEVTTYLANIDDNTGTNGPATFG